ncbi:unnamed protein product [Fraxinus pennsylvanica]|uniref:Uncharacterized protein n=1 Tax=Fraxinus pennsylvanica TaxID=56036 RepID=A0AAD1YXQ0_9LAMI|nr:unnamed protein product [Fraxinus pennsylvanica]
MKTEHRRDIDPDVMVIIVKPQIPAATGGGATETEAALEAAPPVNKERNPETPSQNNCYANHKRRNENRPHTGEENHDNGREDQEQKGLEIGELAAEDGDGRVGGLAEDVKEEPGSEERQEEDEGEGVGEKGNSEHGSDYGEVIDAKIVVVLAEAKSGVGERFRFGECGPVKKLRLWNKMHRMLKQRRIAGCQWL